MNDTIEARDDPTASAPTLEEELSRRWGWLLALGLLMIFTGTLGRSHRPAETTDTGGPTMVMAVRQFETLFRRAASLDVSKNDIKRLEGFVNQRLRDLLLLAQATASLNGRDIIDYPDVPITKGLQNSMREFREMDEALSLKTILEQQAKLPPMKLGYSTALEEKIPELTGGITVSLAKVFRALDPRLKMPGAEEWEKVDRIYEILL